MEEITLPQITTLFEDEQHGVFVIEPLYPGYGYTIGNALRRVLLSSLEGAAVSSVKIEGVAHEFSPVPGVKEDALDIILNLKKLRLKLHGDEPVTISLSVKGPKEVRAKDIKTPSQVEIQNKDLYIATVDSEKDSLVMEMVVEKGRGYLPVEMKPENPEIGLIQIDSAFSPVSLVNIKVENTRVGQRTDFNKLTLEIDTDGTIRPSEALRQATEILIQQFQAILKIPKAKDETVKETAKSKKKEVQKDQNEKKTTKKTRSKKSAA